MNNLLTVSSTEISSLIGALELGGHPPALDDSAMVGQAVEQRCCHLRVADHRMMPQKLTVESLRFEWSTRTTHCSAVIFR